MDIHFEAHQSEYEEAFHIVGYQSRWHVLDAGCGGGSFLPLMTEAVGSHGRVSAIDLDPDNVESIRAQVERSPLSCPVMTCVGDVRELPFPDNTFDAVWCANVLTYITDEDLPGVLTELRRVVKPGGLVASKEGDRELFRSVPIPMEHRAPFYHIQLSIPSMYRSRLLLHWYRRADLLNVWAKSVLVERWAPLDEANSRHISGLLRGGHNLLSKLDPATVSEKTRRYWDYQLDPDSTDCILNQSDFAFAVAQVVTVGTVSG